MEPKLI